jgi:predicted HicB family RNase H-like nuclease
MNLEQRRAEGSMPSKNQQSTTPLRLPAELKDWAKEKAKAQGLSLNGLVIAMLQRQRAVDQTSAG